MPKGVAFPNSGRGTSWSRVSRGVFADRNVMQNPRQILYKVILKKRVFDHFSEVFPQTHSVFETDSPSLGKDQVPNLLHATENEPSR
jgi:hypothetical protein